MEPQDPVSVEELTDVEIVSKVLTFAKLDLCSLKPYVQQVYFANPLESDSTKLLELNPDTLSYVENGGKLILKGNSTENCVVCTDRRTYEVKEAEISNSLLLVPNLKVDPPPTGTESENELHIGSALVEAVRHNYLELKLVKPKLNAIQQLLAPGKYNGPENEDENTVNVMKEDVYREIGASEMEIDDFLSSLDIVELDGFLRLLDFDYITRVLCSITSFLEENSWHYDEFSRQETIKILSDLYPSEIVDHILTSYGCNSPGADSDDVWSLSEDKICRFFAELLLRPTKKFNFQEFMDAWRQSVPEGMMTSLSQTRGLAFVDSSTEPAVIRYFPESVLSDDVKKRFEELFEAKEAWSMEEITPYIEPLCIGKMTVSVMVTKFARAFNRNGVKYYTSKYTK